MVRQRSGSSSARNPRGPRGTRPAATRSTGKSVAKPVDEPVVDEPVVDESAVDKPVADEPAVDESAVDEPVADEPTAELAQDAADAATVDAGTGIDDSDSEPDGDEDVDDEDSPTAAERSEAAAELWSEVRIAPVEIALPHGSGYTLRAYRMSNELAAVEVDEREDEFAGYLDAEEDDEIDPELLEILTQEPPAPVVADRKVNGRKVDTRKVRDEDDDDDLDIDDDDDDLDVNDELDDDDQSDDDDDSDGDDESDDDGPTGEADDRDDVAEDESDDDESDDDEEDDETDVDVEPAAEEVPVFLGHRGKVYLFESADLLVEFVRSSDEHDLAQLDSWATLKERLTPEDVVPEDEDRYELDLVVENLRGGADALDYTLLIQAGELARDIAYATRLEPVIAALGSGSRLDDLDDAVRTADRGGLRGFLARRKLRRIVTQQTALGWRTIIGKISAVVDWRN